MHRFIKKISYIALAINMMSLAMENKEENKLTRSNPINIPLSSSSSSLKKPTPEENPYTFSLPTLATVTNAFGSLRETVNNYVWDDSAFKKLGWPESDESARQELRKTQEIYQKVNDALKTRVYYETFLQDCDSITRRHEYCQRVLIVLENHPRGVDLALFCLTNHRQAMNQFDITRFLVFVDEKRATITQGTQKVYADLAALTFVPKDNPLLTGVFQSPSVSPVVEKKIEKVEQKKVEKPEQKIEPKKDGKK